MEPSELPQDLILLKNTEICRLCATKNGLIYNTLSKSMSVKVENLLGITVNQG